MMSAPRLRVAAYPRDVNPYQSLVYGAMAEHGVEVGYLGELTPSHSFNLLLLPAEVLVRRARGADIVHVHWAFGFRLPGRDRVRAVGLLSQAWLHVFLRTVTSSGLRLVWTAHNVLPHEAVFWDDVRARRALAEAADLVIAHSPATLEALADLGIRARSTAIVPHGPFPTSAGRRHGDRPEGSRPLTLLYIGAVTSYKGVEDLVRAFGSTSARNARLIIAGRCPDQDLAGRLESAATALGPRIDLRLAWQSDAELDSLLDEADVLVLPYREVTTSGAAVLGLGAGLPLVVPDLPGLAGLPSESVFRYATQDDLAATLEEVTATSREQLRAMGSAGRDAVAGVSWTEIGATTARLFRGLANPGVGIR